MHTPALTGGVRQAPPRSHLSAPLSLEAIDPDHAFILAVAGAVDKDDVQLRIEESVFDLAVSQPLRQRQRFLGPRVRRRVVDVDAQSLRGLFVMTRVPD